jgi:hypothetical protein
MIAVLAQQPRSLEAFSSEGQSSFSGMLVFVGAFIGVVVLMMIVQSLLKRRRNTRAKGRNGRPRASKKRRRLKQKDTDAVSEFTVPVLDMDPFINPPTDRPRPIPNELEGGTVLVSQRLGVKCLLLVQLTEVDLSTLKEICVRKLEPGQGIYLPMGTQLYKEEILHQGRGFSHTLRKGSLFLNVSGHPNVYLLDDLQLPMRKELTSNAQILPVTDSTVQNYLQALLDIPSSFELLKEDVLFETSAENIRTVPKGSLVISRSGALVGLMLEECSLPHKGTMSDLDALFQLQTQYERYPIETLIQRSAKAGGRAIPINRGTFIFSSSGKVYFVWREGVEVDESTLTSWSRESQIGYDGLLEVSKTVGNRIGGPGLVVTQEDLIYLRDVFREAGTTNINVETLLLDKNVFYKFMAELPYAQTGKFRHLLGTSVFQLNTASRGTFSIELGGKDVEITDLDLKAVREFLLPEGKMLIKIGTMMRIRDERYGDWIYIAHTVLFYPYETFTRPYMEEFIPESVRYKGRDKKMSVIIGPQEKPTIDDKGASGEPIGDLPAIINNGLFGKEPKTVFVLDKTLFHWKDRLYRVNEELIYRPHEYAEKLVDRDFQSLAADWKIAPVVEDGTEDEEEPVLLDEEGDLEDLPFDTNVVR